VYIIFRLNDIRDVHVRKDQDSEWLSICLQRELELQQTLTIQPP
jgi:hypothetical protein